MELCLNPDNPPPEGARVLEILTRDGIRLRAMVAVPDRPCRGTVVVMEKFTVRDEALALDAGATGAASLLNRDRLLLQPTAPRATSWCRSRRTRWNSPVPS